MFYPKHDWCGHQDCRILSGAIHCLRKATGSDCQPKKSVGLWAVYARVIRPLLAGPTMAGPHPVACPGIGCIRCRGLLCSELSRSRSCTELSERCTSGCRLRVSRGHHAAELGAVRREEGDLKGTILKAGAPLCSHGEAADHQWRRRRAFGTASGGIHFVHWSCWRFGFFLQVLERGLHRCQDTSWSHVLRRVRVPLGP